MMSTSSPCSSAHIADDVLYGHGDADNNKFVQPVVNSTSPYLNHLSSSQTPEPNPIVTSSQTYKHFLAQKYAAESTSEADSESHSNNNSVNALSHGGGGQSGSPFQHQISNFYPFSPLVTSSSSSSHFDTRAILGDGVLESSVDSLQVESTSANEQNSGHAPTQVLFNENITTLDGFIKQEEVATANLVIASNPPVNVTSSSTRDLMPSNLFDAVNADGTVDSTTTASISTSINANLNHTSLSSYAFNTFQPITSQQGPAPTLSSVLTYGLSPNFSATLLQLDNSHTQPLLPSLPSPSIQIDQYFNNQGPLDKREDSTTALMDQHQLLPSSISQFSSESHCLLSDNLSDNFLHDEIFKENGDILVSGHDNVISDVPVLTRARASLPIDYLFLGETGAGPGVFSRKAIAKNTQFGPIEGVIASFSDTQYSLTNLALSSKGSLIIFISESVVLSQVDENNSNWTRFVRPATSPLEKNIELITKEYTSVNELKFYFITTRNIMPNEELRVWYSKDYCERFDIKTLEELSLFSESELDGGVRNNSSNQLISNNAIATGGGHKLRNKIAKSQLTQLQQSAVGLQEDSANKEQDLVGVPQHESLEQNLNNQIQDLFDEDMASARNESSGVLVVVNGAVDMNNKALVVEGSLNVAANSMNGNNTVATNGPNAKSKEAKQSSNQYTCNICQRVFPRQYSLRRHLVMHSGEKRYKCYVCGMAFNHVYNRNRHMKKHNNTENEAAAGNSVQIVNSEAKNEQVLSNIEPSNNAAAAVVTTIAIPNSSQPETTLPLMVQNYGKPDGNINDDNNNFIDSVSEIAAAQSQQHFDKSIDCNKASPGTVNSDHSSLSGSDNVSSTILANLAETNGSNSTNFVSANKNVHSVDKSFRCSICYKRFSTEERLEKHAMVHDESAKHLSCHICKRKFLTNSALACHIKSHSFSVDEPRKYDCTLCGAVFETIQLRREHVVVHINPETGRYHCSKCPKTFEDFSPIRKHIKSFHSDEIFPCPECDKVFPRQDKLRLHMLCHSDRWEFKCNFCDKQFKRKDKLKEHTQRMHAPDRDVRIAAKVAARMQRLKAQKVRKIATKPSQANYDEFMYKCHQCLLGFKRRGMLVNHLAKRHPEVPYNSVPELTMPIVKTSKDYYCQYCDKIYKSSSKRKAHIIKNHPGKSLPPSNRNKNMPIQMGVPNPTFSATVGSITINPHFCSWCHKQYASKAKLMQHQRKKHPDKVCSSSKSKSEINFSCTSNSESSIGSLKLSDSIAGSSDKSSVDVSQQGDSIPLPIVLKNEQNVDHQVNSISVSTYNSATTSSSSFIDNFGLSSQYAKNGTTSFLNGSNHIQQQHETQYAIDSNDPSLEDLLSITTCIVGDEANQNMLINNSTASHSSLPNNIITILACTVPSSGTTTFQSELGELPNGISDIITQIASDFPNSKMLSTNQVGSTLNSATVNGNALLMGDDSSWNQVCEEMAMV